jgi:hypothetical protein
MRYLIFFRVGYLLQAIFFWLFAYFSDGLFFFDESMQTYKSVKSLYSSGSDDDGAIWLLACFDFVIFLFFLRRGSLRYVSVLMVVSLIFMLFSLTLIQVGSITTTIFVEKSVFISLGFLAKLLVFACWLLILVRDKDVNNAK